MFTGIVEAQGIVRSSGAKNRSLEIEIEPPKISRALKIGGSLMVDGVCLTVVRKKGKRFFFNLVGETIKRSTLGSLKFGDRVHLERALKVGGRIEGHLVLGHVDGVGTVQKILKKKDEKSFLISFPKKIKPYFIEKGSVAVDGVSLTIGRVTPGGFWVHLIPHTLTKTHLGNLRFNSKVNLEADIMAKLAKSS